MFSCLCSYFYRRRYRGSSKAGADEGSFDSQGEDEEDHAVEEEEEDEDKVKCKKKVYSNFEGAQFICSFVSVVPRSSPRRKAKKVE